MTENYRAKRGDLAIIEKRTGNYIIGMPYSESITYEIGVVTSITRDGIVKAVRTRDDEDGVPVARMVGASVSRLVPKASIDIKSAMRAAEEHAWPSGYAFMPFDTLDEVRAALRPCLIEVKP